MGGPSFARPVGAAADVKELEYISALHQTGDSVRLDGSIKDEDIRLFLSSRYGIDVSAIDVRQTILKGMGGDRDTDDDLGDNCPDVIDVMELTAILLIPTLLKAAALEEEGSNNIPNGLLMPPPDLLKYVLDMILHDVTGDRVPKPLTTNLLRRVLQAYGESELANDIDLLQEMVDCCKCDGTDNDATNLTVKSFARGLTHDVKLYDIGNEVRESTHYEDVFRHQDHLVEYDKNITDGKKTIQNVATEPTRVLKRKYTAAAIDFTAGTYRSKGLSIMLWACTLISYFAYVFGSANDSAKKVCAESDLTYALSAPWRENSGAVTCESAVSIVIWVSFYFIFSIFGLTVVGLGSIGNDVYSQQWWIPLIGATVVAVFVFVPFFDETADASTGGRYLNVASLALGIITCTFHLLHAIALMTPIWVTERYTALRTLLRSSTIEGEMHVKTAGALKVHKMINNALYVVQHNEKESVLNSHFSQALFNFPKRGIRECKIVGGLSWSWQGILSRRMFSEEGVWYSTRLLASNLAQYVVSVYILITGIKLIQVVSDNYNLEVAQEQLSSVLERVLDTSVNEELVNSMAAEIGLLVSSFVKSMNATNISNVNCSSLGGFNGSDVIDEFCRSSEGFLQCNSAANVNYLCALLDGPSMDGLDQLGLLNASGFDANVLMETVREILQESANKTVESLYPSSRFMVTVPTAVAVVVATACALYLAITYVPSVTSTILKLRCGVLPSLERPDFARLRCAPDSVSLLTGSLFWGCLGSSLVTGSFFGAIVFFFCWQGSVYFAQRLTALVIGILSITLIRTVIVVCCRLSFYKAFYRKRPAAANISILALEWANFSLSAGFVVARTVKLLLVAAFSVGRIDQPFLAEGIGFVGPIELDGYPTIHMRDVLLNEAHRHPYIEMLGTMYLMKLRYGDNFGRNAGSCWRLVFVYALMPWLHKYRVLTRPDLFSKEASIVEGSENDRGLKSLQFVSLKRLFADGDAPRREAMLNPILEVDSCACGTEAVVQQEGPSTTVQTEPHQDVIDLLHLRVKELESELATIRSGAPGEKELESHCSTSIE